MSSRSPLVMNAGQVQQLQSGDWADIGVPYMMHKNRIINGDFRVSQRNQSGANASSYGFYAIDRWGIFADGPISVDVLPTAFTPGQTSVPDNPRYYCKLINYTTSGETYCNFGQRIEGAETFQGQNATVSFYASADAARTLGVVATRYYGTGGSPSANETIGSTSFNVTTTWQKFTHTFAFPSIAGKTFGTNNDDWAQLLFQLPVNTAATFNIAHVQFEVGSSATTFEHRPLSYELSLCQRYFIRTGYNTPFTFYNSDGGQGSVQLPVPMRATPTIVMPTTAPGVHVAGINGYIGTSTVAAIFGNTSSGLGSNCLKYTLTGFASSIPSGSQSKPAYLDGDYLILDADYHA